MKKDNGHSGHGEQECISALNETLAFTDFLSCFARVLQNGCEETAISQWWTENREQLKSDNPEIEFALFLERVEVIDRAHTPVAKIHEDEMRNPKARELSEQFAKVLEMADAHEAEQRSKAQGELSKYWAFKPAWQFHAILPQLFPEGDPAVLIASNLRAIFPSLHPSMGDEYVAVTNNIRVTHGGHSHQLMIEIAQWISLRTSTVVGKLFKYVLEDESATIWNSAAADFLKAATSHSHALFKLVMDSWELNPAGPRLTKGEELIFLLDLPLSREPDIAGPPHLTPHNLHILSCDHAIDVLYGQGQEDCQVVAKRSWSSFLKRYTEFRHRELDGRSPADIETADSLRVGQESNSFLGEIETDFTIQLAECWNDYGALLPDWDNELVDPESRAEKYLSLVHQARQEGYFELANALLAFFLFSQSLVHRGKLGSDAGIYTAIKEGMALPGSSMLLRSVDVSAQIAEENKNPLVVMKLRQFVSVSTFPAIDDETRLLGEIIVHPSAANVERWLINRLTEKRWNVLAGLSRDALKNALSDFVMFLGKRKNWGSVAVEYCKPFEHEIRQRYEKSYRTWNVEEKDAKHSDAVAIIKMLIKYKSLPSSSQAMIAAIGATLHNERKLLERIEHLMVNYRNLGAHPNEFPEEVLRKLHRKLFDEETLSKFIDCIGPK